MKPIAHQKARYIQMFPISIPIQQSGSAKRLPYVPAIDLSKIGGISPDPNHVAMSSESFSIFVMRVGFNFLINICPNHTTKWRIKSKVIRNANFICISSLRKEYNK